MYKWSGAPGSASLPKPVEEELRRRTTKILDRHGLGGRSDIVQEIVDEVSWALAGSKHQLKQGERGRPVNAPEKLLAVLVPEVLKKHGVRGNWLGTGDDEEDGVMGTVAELEAVAQAALRQARNQDRGTMSRPARTSEARRILGKVFRNDPLPKVDPNN
jgi:hypothetical protein